MNGSVLGRSLLALLVVALVGSVGGVAGGARALRVAYVTDLGTPTDRGIGQAEYAGFARAVKRFGLQSRVVQVPPAGSADGALASLARQRYDLVVAGPFIPAEVVVTVARRYPGVKFLTLFAADGVVPHPPRNVREVGFRVQEAAYLGGFLAALTLGGAGLFRPLQRTIFFGRGAGRARRFAIMHSKFPFPPVWGSS